MSDDANKDILTDNVEASAPSEGQGTNESASFASDSNDPVIAEPEALTPEEIEALKAKAAQSDQHWEKLLRVSADFDNYKKRAARERQEAIKFANESLLEKILPVLDSFEAALAAVNTGDPGSVEALKTGVSMIHSQLKNVMNEAGLEEIDALGKPFDPAWHEAIAEQESAEVPEGQVMQQLRKGYKLRDRLLRPAVVVVSRKPAA